MAGRGIESDSANLTLTEFEPALVSLQVGIRGIVCEKTSKINTSESGTPRIFLSPKLPVSDDWE